MRQIWKCEIKNENSAIAASDCLSAVKHVRLGSAIIVLISESWMVNCAINAMFDFGFYVDNDSLTDFDLDELVRESEVYKRDFFTACGVGKVNYDQKECDMAILQVCSKNVRLYLYGKVE